MRPTSILRMRAFCRHFRRGRAFRSRHNSARGWIPSSRPGQVSDDRKAEPPFIALVRKVPARAGIIARGRARTGERSSLMMPRTRLVLGLCGLAMAAPTLPAIASPDDGLRAGYAAPAPQPSAGTQPTIGLEPSAGYAPTAGYAPSAAPAGYAATSGYRPTAAASGRNRPENGRTLGAQSQGSLRVAALRGMPARPCQAA